MVRSAFAMVVVLGAGCTSSKVLGRSQYFTKLKQGQNKTLVEIFLVLKKAQNLYIYIFIYKHHLKFATISPLELACYPKDMQCWPSN